MKKNTRLALSILAGAIVVVAIIVIAGRQFGFIGAEKNSATGAAHTPVLQGQSFGAWILTCGNTPQTANRCALVMRATEKKTGRIVLSLAVTRGPKGNPILIASVPPDVMIPAGVIIKPGNANAIRGGFQVCDRRRCQAIFLIDDTLNKALDAADETGVRFTMAGSHPFGVKLPTKNFEQAFNAWSVKSPGPAPMPAQTQAAPESGAAVTPAHAPAAHHR